MTAFGEEPAKDPLAQLEEEMGIGEEIQRIQEYLDGLRPEGRTVSLTDLMQVIIQGNMKEIVNTAVSLLWILIKSIAKIEYKIRKEKRKSVLIEVYSNKLKTELSKAYLQL